MRIYVRYDVTMWGVTCLPHRRLFRALMKLRKVSITNSVAGTTVHNDATAQAERYSSTC